MRRTKLSSETSHRSELQATMVVLPETMEAREDSPFLGLVPSSLATKGRTLKWMIPATQRGSQITWRLAEFLRGS